MLTSSENAPGYADRLRSSVWGKADIACPNLTSADGAEAMGGTECTGLDGLAAR